MSVGVSEALLVQKIEFLLTEIEELKKKEVDLKRTNDCLLQALGSEPTSPDSSLQELKKTVELQEQELTELKSRYKEKICQLEKDKQDLLTKVSDLEFSLKQQKLLLETEKLELINQLQKQESDKYTAQTLLNTLQSEKSSQDNMIKYQLELKISELLKEIELVKETNRNELYKARQESEKALFQLKLMYESEIETVRGQLTVWQEKYRKEKMRVEEFFNENDLKFWQHKVEELENELEFLKSGRLQKIEENESLFISSKEEISEIQGSKMKKNRKSVDFEYENLVIQNERLKLQVDRGKMELGQISEELEKTRKEMVESENGLKNEIKFLIGKLLKAKSKLSVEGELSDTIRRDHYMNTIRFKNFDKPLSRNSPVKFDEYY